MNEFSLGPLKTYINTVSNPDCEHVLARLYDLLLLIGSAFCLELTHIMQSALPPLQGLPLYLGGKKPFLHFTFLVYLND